MSLKLQKQMLKGMRWLLLKNPENLDPARNEPRRLHEGLTRNLRPATSYVTGQGNKTNNGVAVGQQLKNHYSFCSPSPHPSPAGRGSNSIPPVLC